MAKFSFPGGRTLEPLECYFCNYSYYTTRPAVCKHRQKNFAGYNTLYPAAESVRIWTEAFHLINKGARVLTGLEPASVFLLEEIRHRHLPTTKALSDCRQDGLACRQDEMGNVLIKAPATPGTRTSLP